MLVKFMFMYMPMLWIERLFLICLCRPIKTLSNWYLRIVIFYSIKLLENNDIIILFLKIIISAWENLMCVYFNEK